MTGSAAVLGRIGLGRPRAVRSRSLRRAAPSQQGATPWMITFADMMSLLLGFFVMVVALSQFRDEAEYGAVVEGVQKAFGMQAGGGKVAAEGDPSLSLIDRLEAMESDPAGKPLRSNSNERGVAGPEASVTKVREGLLFAIGGRITFGPGSADLDEYAKDQLRQMVEVYKVRGTRNIIELRGHAAPMEAASERYPDVWALSYTRARAVMDYLTSDELGLEADRFRLIASADREPLVKRAYTAAEQEPNRRVEVLVNESLVRELEATEPAAR